MRPTHKKYSSLMGVFSLCILILMAVVTAPVVLAVGECLQLFILVAAVLFRGLLCCLTGRRSRKDEPVRWDCDNQGKLRGHASVCIP